METQQMSKKAEDHGKSQAKAQAESIAEMVAALEPTECEKCGKWHAGGEDQSGCDSEYAGDTENEAQENARERISEDPLSIEVRSDWYTPGDADGQKPAQFNILLCTGGPACRITGELDEHGQPDRAWLEYQDWGTPWTQYFDVEQDTLLAYAREFCFAE